MPPRSILPDKPYFHDEQAARSFLEARRWPDGKAVCPYCRLPRNTYRLTPHSTAATACRPGLWKCGICRRQFTVTIGTLFEAARLPLHKWLAAAYLYFSIRKSLETQGPVAAPNQRRTLARHQPRTSPFGASPLNARELHLALGISRKTAYSVLQRLSYAQSERKELSPDPRSLLRFDRVAKALLRVVPERKHPLALERRLAKLNNSK